MTKRRGSMRDLVAQIDALRRMRQKIAFDANVFQKMGVDSEFGRRRAAEYRELSRQIGELEAELRDRKAARAAGLGDPALQPDQIQLSLGVDDARKTG